jgi:phospholipid/cholesterol/gamma-HCH transport system substrate-binding protein
MAVGTNRWKLGLFVIIGLALALTALVVLGARNWSDKTARYLSFFDESVQGLDVGSPVKFRGVTIGRVSAIDVAVDHRHVQVENELFVEQLARLGLGSVAQGDHGLSIPQQLRVQVAQAGITGVKFIQLDYFDGTGYPAPVLPFKTPPNTIPSTPSTMKNLEDSVVRAANQFPDIAAAMLGSVAKLNALMDQVEQERLPARAGATLTETNSAMAELKKQLHDLKAGELSAQAEQNLSQFNQTLQRVDRLVQRLESDEGLMRSAERAANSLNEVARGAQSVGPEFELTLREVKSAARSVRRFTDALERDPDMLLKGRATAVAR